MGDKLTTIFHLVSFEKYDFLKQAQILDCFINPEDILLFSYYEVEENAQTLEMIKKASLLLGENENIFEDDKETRDFINARTVLENTDWLLPWEPFRKIVKAVWFEPLNINEVVQSIKINQNFICVVLKQKAVFADHSFVLSPIDCDNGVNLQIIEKNKGKFKELVHPRLQQLLEHVTYKTIR